jgi:heparanase 1
MGIGISGARRAFGLFLGIGLGSLACQNHPPKVPPPPPPSDSLALVIDGGSVISTVDQRFLSVAIDSAQVTGGTFWAPLEPDGGVGTGTEPVAPFSFSSTRLRTLASALAPAYLRIGGTAADSVYYDMSASPVTTAPSPFLTVLNHTEWDELNSFAHDVGFQVLFSLAAGPGTRDQTTHRWLPDQARTLVSYTAQNGYDVALWELGNEFNGFGFTFGNDWVISGTDMVPDFTAARQMLNEVAPGAKLGGPSSAFWPVDGELNPVFPQFMSAGGGAQLDVVTWHYYPMESVRCPVAVVPADDQHLFKAKTLDEISTWAAQVESQSATSAPGAHIWLGESGGAQCGGQPGISDRFADSFWWLDELGLLAKRGEPVVVRQTLTGSDYGLLDDSFVPRPDYWASLLFRQLMGTQVLDASVANDSLLRVYAHCARTSAPGAKPGAVVAMILNLNLAKGVDLKFPPFPGGDDAVAWVLTAPTTDSPSVMLNGQTLALGTGDALPSLSGAPLTEGITWMSIPTASIAFVLFPSAGLSICP